MRVNYGLNRVRFPAPVRADSQIRARISVQSTKEFPDATEATYSVLLECRGGGKALLRGGMHCSLLSRMTEGMRSDFERRYLK